MAGELRDEVVDRSRTFNLVQLVWEDAEHRKESNAWPVACLLPGQGWTRGRGWLASGVDPRPAHELSPRLSRRKFRRCAEALCPPRGHPCHAAQGRTYAHAGYATRRALQTLSQLTLRTGLTAVTSQTRTRRAACSHSDRTRRAAVRSICAASHSSQGL